MGHSARTAPAPLPSPTAPSCAQRPRAATFRGSKRPRWPAGGRACAPASAAAARRRLLTPSTCALRGAPSRGGRSHPPACAPCGAPRPLRAGALRGGVTAPPEGVAPRRRAAAAAVAAAAPLSPPHTPPSTATWPYVPPWVLAAMDPAGVPSVDASPSAPPPRRPGYCTYVPGI